jgi:hypothetical protein
MFGSAGISKFYTCFAQSLGVLPSWSRKQYLGTTMLLLTIAFSALSHRV